MTENLKKNWKNLLVFQIDLSIYFLFTFIMFFLFPSIAFYILVLPYVAYMLLNNALFSSIANRKNFKFDKKKIPLTIVMNLIYLVIYCSIFYLVMFNNIIFISLFVVLFIVDWSCVYISGKNLLSLLFKL